jgi:hypothetical protein
VHDLDEDLKWNRVLTISANPSASRHNLHVAALVVYLRADSKLGDLNSCVLGFRAGALAAFEINNDPARRFIAAVSEVSSQSRDGFHDDKVHDNFADTLAMFLDVDKYSACNLSKTDNAVKASLKRLSDGKIDLAAAYFLLRNAAAVKDELPDALNGKETKQCCDVGLDLAEYCSTLYAAFSKLCRNNKGDSITSDVTLTKFTLKFQVNFDISTRRDEDRPALLESLTKILVHNDRTHRPGNAALAIERLWLLHQKRRGFDITETSASLFLTSSGLTLKLSSSEGSSIVLLGYPEQEQEVR